MYQCKFCGSVLPDHASFCGQCGRTPGEVIEASTRVGGLHIPDIQDSDTASTVSVTGKATPHWEYNQLSSIIQSPTSPLGQEEEEERRRRAAMFGMGVPLLGDLAVEGQPYAGNVPMVQSTPQMGNVPTVQGTPHVPGGFIGQGFHSNPTVMAPQLPATPPTFPFPDTTTTLHHPHHPHHPPHPHHPHHPHTPHHKPKGCSSVFIIAAISIPILILLSLLGLGLTVLAPGLSLSGSAGVVQGGTFTLHGNHFLPGSSVTLTLDDTTPLYFTRFSSPVQLTNAAKASMQVLGLVAQQTKQVPSTSNTVSVGGDGTFGVTITANPGWSIGKHKIKASESPTHRSAELNFTIYMAGTTPTPPATGTASPSPSATASPSPTTTLTPTATTTVPSLSCVNPSSLSLGPVSLGYNQPVSAQVTLCTSGTGTVNWTATWNQNAAPWLHLDHTSGQVSAPGQVLVNISALAENLTPGSYAVTLTYSGQQNSVTESLPVSFTVQAGCVSGTSNALKYSGVANVSDPAAQTIAITNCGPVGAWSANALTSDGTNWLFVSPTANTLNAGASIRVTISASNLKAQLPAGTYTGTVTFKIGSGTFIVNVTLVVAPAPTLSGTPTLIFANRQCQLDPTGFWICYVSLTNTSANLSLHWSATSSGIHGVNFSPSTGTLSPGQTISIKISIPQSDCPTKGILTFTGPANAVNVEWYCIAG